MYYVRGGLILFCLRNMPDVEDLMQEWPPQFEEALKEVILQSSV